MAYDHSNCAHPRTPTGRAACRKARAGGTPLPTVTPDMLGDTRDDRVGRLLRDVAPITKAAGKTIKSMVHTAGCIAGEVHKGRCIVKVVTTEPKTSTKSLKRPGTKIKGLSDMADVPRVFTPAIETAHSAGCIVRVGEPYNDTERRVELFGPAGVVTLVWLAANPHGVNDVQFRPAKSSVSSRQPSVNEALRVAGIAA